MLHSGRQVLDAVSLLAPDLAHAAPEGDDGFDVCAEALSSAACDDLSDDVMLLKAEHLLQRGDLEAASRILQVMHTVILELA